MHMLTVESDMDLDKLGHVDELTNRVGRTGTPFAFAYWRLKTILNSPPILQKQLVFLDMLFLHLQHHLYFLMVGYFLK